MAKKASSVVPTFTATLRIDIIVSVPVPGATYEEALANAQRSGLISQMLTSNVELSDVIRSEVASLSNDKAWD